MFLNKYKEFQVEFINSIFLLHRLPCNLLVDHYIFRQCKCTSEERPIDNLVSYSKHCPYICPYTAEHQSF